MKKSLLFASFAVLAMTANAQWYTEATTESLAEAGLVKEELDQVEGGKIEIQGGTIFAEGEAGTIAVAATDNWGITAPCGNYKTVIVGETEVNLSTGAVGNTNPTMTSYANALEPSGAMFLIQPSKDGWLTVFTKMSPNKPYYVFEGKQTGMAYHLGYANPVEGNMNIIDYTLPYDPETFAIDFTADDASKYFKWPVDSETKEPVEPATPNDVTNYQVMEVAGLTDNPGNQTGFLTFNVVAGSDYYFFATGSKAPCGVFVITESEKEPDVTFVATDTLPEVTFEGTMEMAAGIEGIVADPVNENAPVYNLFGQKVDDSYKGIVIKNGKKFIRR